MNGKDTIDQLRRVVIHAGGARLQKAGFRQVVAGEDGLGMWDNTRSGLRIIHSMAWELDGEVWSHVSISNRSGYMPSWGQTRDAWRLIHPDKVGVIVVPPKSEHVNIAEVAHVWGSITGRTTPDFTRGTGMI